VSRLMIYFICGIDASNIFKILVLIKQKNLMSVSSATEAVNCRWVKSLYNLVNLQFARKSVILPRLTSSIIVNMTTYIVLLYQKTHLLLILWRKILGP
jgi:hypothetical protein